MAWIGKLFLVRMVKTIIIRKYQLRSREKEMGRRSEGKIEVQSVYFCFSVHFRGYTSILKLYINFGLRPSGQFARFIVSRGNSYWSIEQRREYHTSNCRKLEKCRCAFCVIRFLNEIFYIHICTIVRKSTQTENTSSHTYTTVTRFKLICINEEM